MTYVFNGPFWLLAYDTHYPYGGLGNVYETFATMDEAEAQLARMENSGKPEFRYDHMYIVEVAVKEGGK